MTEAIIAKAFLHDGMQRLIPTGPGRSVSFRSGGAFVFDERDMPMLLLTPGITVEVQPDWADRYPLWLKEIEPGFPKCVVQGVFGADPGDNFGEEEPDTSIEISSNPVVETTARKGTTRRRKKQKEAKPKSAYSPKGRKLNLSPEARQARGDRARRNFQKV